MCIRDRSVVSSIYVLQAEVLSKTWLGSVAPFRGMRVTGMGAFIDCDVSRSPHLRFCLNQTEWLDEPRVMRAYEDWNAHVVRAVPPERLLVYNVTQGWGPLAAHLGVEVPEAAFPHINDRESVQRFARMLRAASMFLPGLASFAAAVVVSRAVR